MLGGKENNVIIKAIAIDKDFLSKGEEEKFFDCLIEHELSEVEFYLKNPEKHKAAIETVKRGEPANPEAHLFALGEEMKKADQLGVLEKYCEHWKMWLKKEMEKITDDAVKTAIEERLAWREQALIRFKREKEQAKEIKLR